MLLLEISFIINFTRSQHGDCIIKVDSIETRLIDVSESGIIHKSNRLLFFYSINPE